MYIEDVHTYQRQLYHKHVDHFSWNCTMSRGYTYKPGTKLMLELVYGNKYAGNVRDCEEGQITLIKVYDFETQTEGKSNFPLHFYEIEIRNITVLEEVHEPPSDEPPPTYYQKHHEKLDIMIRNFIYIIEKNHSFNYAIKCIKSCEVISIAALVTHFGKNFCLTLLGVGTPKQVFIFDLKLMGPTAFENGLKEILESNIILKVVHTSKKLSESLIYHHNVSLRYIFDTQVADLTVSFRANSTVHPKPRYLSECIWFYFDVPQHVTSCFFINFMRLHARPLDENYKMSMATQTVFLLKLKEHLEQQMNIEFGEVQKFYMNFRRQGTLADSWKMNTLKILKQLDDPKPKSLENIKLLSASSCELTAEQSETSQPTLIDEQVKHMDQLFLPLTLTDYYTESENTDS
ncbi:uncharacterized protein CBL_14265 [Carabus blaptoides fortunei]